MDGFGFFPDGSFDFGAVATAAPPKSMAQSQTSSKKNDCGCGGGCGPSPTDGFGFRDTSGLQVPPDVFAYRAGGGECGCGGQCASGSNCGCRGCNPDGDRSEHGTSPSSSGGPAGSGLAGWGGHGSPDCMHGMTTTDITARCTYRYRVRAGEHIFISNVCDRGCPIDPCPPAPAPWFLAGTFWWSDAIIDTRSLMTDCNGDLCDTTYTAILSCKRNCIYCPPWGREIVPPPPTWPPDKQCSSNDCVHEVAIEEIPRTSYSPPDRDPIAACRAQLEDSCNDSARVGLVCRDDDRPALCGKYLKSFGLLYGTRFTMTPINGGVKVRCEATCIVRCCHESTSRPSEPPDYEFPPGSPRRPIRVGPDGMPLEPWR